MNKSIEKTETVAEFLARGGKITRVEYRGEKKTRQRRTKTETEAKSVDMSHLPAALKIKYGIK